MKKDKFIWVFLSLISVIVMGILGWRNYIQTDYNKFLLILVSAGFVLIMVIWRKGVNFQGKGEDYEAEE